MTWQCKLIIYKEYFDSGRKPEVGDMWFCPEMLEGEVGEYYTTHKLSPEYFKDWFGKRPPLVVCLPNDIWWSGDFKAEGEDSGWTVIGEAPNITVQPSINYPGEYHGWLINGVISDDIEGRNFEKKEDKESPP